MLIEEIDSSTEKQIVTGMILDDAVVATIASKWDKNTEGLFDSKWSNQVAFWCVQYFNKYGKAPKEDIQVKFEKWAEKCKDQNSVQLIEKFLYNLSKKYIKSKRKINPTLVLDTASEHFNRVAATRLLKEAETVLNNEGPDKFRKLINESSPIEIGSGSTENLFTDYTIIERAFDAKRHPLIKFKHPDAAAFFGDIFERDSLVSFTAPAKTGKTFWLMEIAYRGIRAGHNVAFFQCGDLSSNQMAYRFGVKIARTPQKDHQLEQKIPRTLEYVQGKLLLTHEEVKYKKPLSLEQVKRAFKKLVPDPKNNPFKMVVRPNNSINIAQIRAIIKNWQKIEKWSPDIICIAEGSLVLTDSGLKRIESIGYNDRLWDGNSWVSHSGLLDRGIRNVITYQGLTATPDHKVQTKEGWRSLITCRQLGLSIAQTGEGRREVRFSRDCFPSSSSSCSEKGKTRIRVCRMCAVQKQKMDYVLQHQTWDQPRLPHLLTTQTISSLALCKNAASEGKMREHQSQEISVLRRSRDRISIQNNCRCLPLDAGSPAFTQTPQFRIGSYRQQRTLRTWKYPIINTKTKYESYLKETMDTYDAQVSTFVSFCEVCGQYDNCLFHAGSESQADFEEMEKDEKTCRVWDIINTGPFHRFTVQNLLVHNCIDYADILAPVNGQGDSRQQINETWKLMRALSQECHACLLTATQSDAASYQTEVITRSNFTDDRRKNDHVTAMIAINQNDEERAKGIQRLNITQLREDYFNPEDQLIVAGCLGIGAPMIKCLAKQNEIKFTGKGANKDA